MTKFLLILLSMLVMSQSQALGVNIGPWSIVNDTVMGGQSRSSIQWADDNLLFSGELSLANRGGFASTRANLSFNKSAEVSYVLLSVIGDGRDYQLRFRTDDRFDGFAYAATFSTAAGNLSQIKLTADQFNAVFRGYRVANAPEFKFVNAKQIGFMLADKQAGPFALRIVDLYFN